MIVIFKDRLNEICYQTKLFVTIRYKIVLHIDSDSYKNFKFSADSDEMWTKIKITKFSSSRLYLRYKYTYVVTVAVANLTIGCDASFGHNFTVRAAAEAFPWQKTPFR